MALAGADYLNLAIGTFIAVPCALGAVVGLRAPTPRWRGIGAGCVTMLVGVLVFGAAHVMVQDERKQIKAGWNLIPVVVAADQIRAGTVLTYDMVSQRPVPEQFVFDSMVRPDSANKIIGQRVIGTLEAGDPVTWLSTGQGAAPGVCERSAH